MHVCSYRNLYFVCYYNLMNINSKFPAISFFIYKQFLGMIWTVVPQLMAVNSANIVAVK